jgi:hypothetical protein
LLPTDFPSQRHRPLGESSVLKRTYLLINYLQVIVLTMTLRAVARLVINPRVEKQQGVTCLLLGVRRVASFISSVF